MSDQEAKSVQVTTTKKANKLEEVLLHGMMGSIAYAGGELSGFSMKIGQVDYLITLRARFPAGHMISWVGGENMVEVFLKAERLAASGELSWRQDRYRMDDD